MIHTTRSLLAMVLAVGVAACGGGETESQRPAQTGQSEAPAAAAESATEMAEAAASEAEAAGNAAAEAASDMAAEAQSAAASGGPAGGGAAGACAFDVVVNDTLSYSVSEITAPADCTEFTINLTHEGNLPASAMGHNWVLVPEGTAQAVATAGMGVGLDGDYLPEDDRIIAATEIIGGGGSTSITFSLEGLSGPYTYVCTFPGHWGPMRGTFTVES